MNHKLWLYIFYDYIVKFDEYFKDLISGKNEDHPIPAVIGKIECPMPTDHTVYDFMFEVILLMPVLGFLDFNIPIFVFCWYSVL